MAAYPRLRLNAALPPIAGFVAAILVAFIFVVLPQNLLEDWTWNSGVAALIPVAQPPLGTTARAILALGFGAIAAAVVWSSLYLLFGPGGFLAPRMPTGDGVPILRRADSHPDAPARRPISAAADFGDPVLPPVPPLVRDLPVDLDQPLAAYDPHAILPSPREPVRPVAPVAMKPAVAPPVDTKPVETEPTQIQPVVAPDPTPPVAPPIAPSIAVVEPIIPEPAIPLRIEAERPAKPQVQSAPLPVPSTPAAGAPTTPVDEDRDPPSIETLLARLERGARRRPDAPRVNVDEALGTLRGLSR